MALLSVLALTACVDMSQLSFTNDHRLHFTQPAHRALVDRPVEISWTMTDFRVTAPGSEPPTRDAGYFALFVDQAPVAPGHHLADVGAGDPECRRSPGCPDKSYLADHGVYTTTRTSIILSSVSDLAIHDDPQLHTVTVVLLDTASRRIGESAWYVEFELPTRDY